MVGQIGQLGDLGVIPQSVIGGGSISHLLDDSGNALLDDSGNLLTPG